MIYFLSSFFRAIRRFVHLHVSFANGHDRQTERFCAKNTHVADFKCRLNMFRCPTEPQFVMRVRDSIGEAVAASHRIALRALEKRPNRYRYECLG